MSVSLRLPLLLCLGFAVLGGCAGSPAPADPGALAGRATPWPDPLAACANFSVRPEYAPLRPRLALDNLAGQTPAMRTDRARPTRTERALIRRWAGERQVCLSAAVQAQRPDSSLPMIAIDEEMLASTQALDADLAAGRLSYGAYAQRRQHIADRYNDDWQRAEAAWVAELNAAAARRMRVRSAYGGDPFYEDRFGGPMPGVTIGIGIGRGL